MTLHSVAKATPFSFRPTEGSILPEGTRRLHQDRDGVWRSIPYDDPNTMYGVACSADYIFGKTGARWPRMVYYHTRESIVTVLNEHGIWVSGTPGGLSENELDNVRYEHENRELERRLTEQLAEREARYVYDLRRARGITDV